MIPDNPHIGILGFGEIGSSLKKCIGPDLEISISDPAQAFNDDLSRCDVVHVCVPQPALFVAMGERKWGEMKDQICIIHTTVRPGDTQVIADHFKECFAAVYHAPVRGKHPDLSAGMQNFLMPFSGPTSHQQEVADYMDSVLNIPMDYWGQDYINTELAKLLSTLRYAWEIMWRKHLQHLCDMYDADPKLVNDQWTEQYNEGYDLLDFPQFRRSILDFVEGPIGGHCVIPNAKLIKESSEIAKWILYMNSRLESVPDADPVMSISVK